MTHLCLPLLSHFVPIPLSHSFHSFPATSSHLRPFYIPWLTLLVPCDSLLLELLARLAFPWPISYTFGVTNLGRFWASYEGQLFYFNPRPSAELFTMRYLTFVLAALGIARLTDAFSWGSRPRGTSNLSIVARLGQALTVIQEQLAYQSAVVIASTTRVLSHHSLMRMRWH